MPRVVDGPVALLGVATQFLDYIHASLCPCVTLEEMVRRDAERAGS
jgi:hypothetical protein